ncbi:hypothetical protein [Devosia neptuniae]|uniref:hypothetical protein n=1 Tax=Devosia neptuniae TaxID=191302 RepID=UPI0022AF4B37|nr:hypothetical protein [Devosia neptuniae]MCZ4348069.1 hypothetical protein [Devosia neptuniae]
MILIGEARMRAIRVQHLEEAVDVVVAVLRPFISINGQEPDRGLGELARRFSDVGNAFARTTSTWRAMWSNSASRNVRS